MCILVGFYDYLFLVKTKHSDNNKIHWNKINWVDKLILFGNSNNIFFAILITFVAVDMKNA